jgi:hypothetical protein
MKHAQRELIRVAQAICQSNQPRCEPAISRLPTSLWEAAERLHRRADYARDRGWNGAARRLTEELKDAIEDLAGALERCRVTLNGHEGANVFATAQEIFADLLALPGEFPHFDYDHREKTLTAVTAPIAFDEVWLGPFAIELHWEGIYYARHGAYRVIAQEPNPSQLDEETTHPHVQGEVLCEGDAAPAIRRALAQGRLVDFFLLVRSVLGTYNPDSPYITIENWYGSRCEECDYTAASDEMSCCSNCDRRLCDDCYLSCAGCERCCCYDCRADCAVCQETFCNGCLETCSACSRPVCPNCRDINLKCEKCHETTKSESSQPESALQPNRLGEACVPA